MGSRWLVFVVALIGLGVCGLILATGPEPLESNQTQALPKVATGALERGQAPVQLDAFGALEPRQSLQLTAQVSGEITWVSDSLIAGGSVAPHDALFRLDDRDYKIAVASAEARLSQAQATIDLERGRAEIAKLEWAAWQRGQQDNQPASALALRVPQQAEAQALRNALRAELDQARLNLERTEVTSPWPASVVAANAIPGQVLAAGEVVATLFPVDFGVVELQVPVSTLQVFDQGLERIELRPVQNGNLPPVAGELDTIVRTLTDNTRLATVRVRVDRPLQHPGWTYGMHLQADIVAKQIRNLAYIPSDLVVSGNLVWILRQGRATRHQVTPVGNSGRVVSVLDNFAPGDELILERPIGLFDGAEVAVAALADFGPEALAGMGR